MDKSISIIVPCFNEERCIELTLDRINNYFVEKGIQFEIITIDDGSTDTTLKLTKTLSERIGNIHIYKNPFNMGKGYSVGVGVHKSNCEYILFTDADLSTPIEEFDKFIMHVNKDEKIMIGSRKMPGANVVMRQPLVREFLGKSFTRLSNLILGTNHSDITCGFKCFEAEVAKRFFQ